MVPTLTREQRTEALLRAAEARTARARAKRALKAGHIHPLDALDMPAMQRCPVAAFFESLPGIGGAKAAMLMDRFGVSPCKRVGGLGSRQREQIIDYLKERYGVRGVPAE